MSTMEDNDKHQNVDISNPQSENNDNLIADSQGESKQENEIVEEEKTPKPKLKGKASEVYKNKNTNKGPSTKKKGTGIREKQNLDFRNPREWEVGKILAATLTEDERRFQSWYHLRQTPEQHKHNLKQAYDRWEAEVASRKGYVSSDLIDDLIRLEWLPDDELEKKAIAPGNRGKETGHTVAEERARYIYERAFYQQCAWRDYHYSGNPFEPTKCHLRKKEIEL